MPNLKEVSILLVLFILLIRNALGVEFTFELEDNTKQCFYQDIEKDVKASLEYQVISGGKLDVDCTVEDSDGLQLYGEKRKSYDTYQWDAQKAGAYKICFSNEFSSITHKTVYFDLNVGNEEPLLDSMNRATALSQMETSCVSIHERLKDVVDHQTHFKLREAHGRAFALGLGTRVQIWSIAQVVIMVVVMTGQVFVLRSFFANKHRPIHRTDT